MRFWMSLTVMSPSNTPSSPTIGSFSIRCLASTAMAPSSDVPCGADAVMIGSPLARATEAPGRGFHWSKGGPPVAVAREGSLEEVVGRLASGLRTSMATTGYETLKEFQKAEVVVHA